MARRLGGARHLVVGTRSESSLSTAIDLPRAEGCSVEGYQVDVGEREQAVAAQSANSAMVSGATHTSGGYQTSLQSALDQAGI